VILSLLGSGIPLHYDSDYTTMLGIGDWGMGTGKRILGKKL